MARPLVRHFLVTAATILPLHCAASPAHFTTLYSFEGVADGGGPRGMLYHSGALYGATHHSGSAACYGDGCGTMFEINPVTGSETELYAFQGAPADGSYETAGLTASGGMLYGTTSTGGTANLGTIYRYNPCKRTETIMYNFKGYPSDGAYPAGTLLIHDGAIYGTTTYGGANCSTLGCGTAFKIDIKTGAERVLYSFAGGADGAGPTAGLIYHEGAFYGTTQGGDVVSDYGTVFKLQANPGATTETIVHAFRGGADGAYPSADLLYHDGAVYGTTQGGDTDTDFGTVFKIPVDGPARVETVLHAFGSGRDGALPQAGLVFVQGYLYGTTVLGGTANAEREGYGTVYKLALSNATETVMYRFTDEAGGRNPEAPLIPSADALYGTTFFGGVGCNGVGCGTVFKLSR